jgi:SP family galactose:H+ symporter-like MFS transporter
MTYEQHAGQTPGDDQLHRSFVYMAAGFAAIGGLLFGYDTGVISGAVLFLDKEFQVSTFALELIVSGVLVGAAVGSLVGGTLADKYGRRGLLFVTAFIFAAGAIICGAAPSVAILIVGRVIVGLGIGLASGTVPVYISEVSAPENRGWQVSLFQLAITIGIVLAYLVDYALAPSRAWRPMLSLAVVPAVVFGAGMLFLPESPRWLLKRGRRSEALHVLTRIRGTAEAEREVEEIERSLVVAEEHGGLTDLFHPAVRAALVVGLGLAVFQQITGINTVIYYAPVMIQSAGIPSASGAILATLGIGLVNVLMTVVSMKLLDRMGRRPLLLVGIAGMTVTLAALGFVFRRPVQNAESATLAVVCMMVYVASFAISLGPIFWLLISEIYPLKIRSTTEGLSAAFNWGANLLVSLTFLTLVQMLGASWTFWLYGICAAGAWIFSYYRVPETKGRSLEEIEALFRAAAPARAVELRHDARGHALNRP